MLPLHICDDLDEDVLNLHAERKTGQSVKSISADVGKMGQCRLKTSANARMSPDACPAPDEFNARSLMHEMP